MVVPSEHIHTQRIYSEFPRHTLSIKIKVNSIDYYCQSLVFWQLPWRFWRTSQRSNSLSHAGISSQPYRLDRLTSLPSKLLTQIYGHLLSPVDRVCLCLCNHRLYILFMTYYQFPSLRCDNLSIFARLERDLPGYCICDICNILHRYDGSERFWAQWNGPYQI